MQGTLSRTVLSPTEERGAQELFIVLCASGKKVAEEDLIEGVKAAGAMSLIDLAAGAKGTLCF